MGNLQASPSSSTATPEEKYDVFINFRGKDIRDRFANTLREALLGKQIRAFMDDQLPKGERNTQLFKTIEQSKISIVIFSEDYGSSKWCLRELVKIMERKKINKQTVIPVFYGIRPSDVRKDSFVKHKEKFPSVLVGLVALGVLLGFLLCCKASLPLGFLLCCKASLSLCFCSLITLCLFKKKNKENFPEEVPKWKEALIDASRIEGWESSVTRPDTKLVNAIVDDIYKKLTGDENILSTGLIGLDERINKVESLLCLHKTDVRIIGIWGMGGIGKTTLAEAIFKQTPGHQFGGVCLILNFKENIKKNGTECLQKDILSKLVPNELVDPISIPQIIQKRLNQTRVFIVLDDVDNSRPLETLARRVGGLGQGSRIIITSRNRSVLLNCGVDDQNIYEVKKFNHDEALQLFCNRAFNQNQPIGDLKVLLEDVVNYANGNPLALTVLGSSLKGKREKEWESAVKTLRINVDREISDVLKISYDGLNAGEQDVFLDIACFLKGKSRDYVATILDDCEYSLSVLIDKSLITVSTHGLIEMHDLLQDLGKDIVDKESPRRPGERSRLWRQKDVQDTLKRGDGTNAVQGIFLDMSEIKDMHLSLEAFNKMYNLRLLKFYNSNKRDNKLYNSWLLTFYPSNKSETKSLNKVHFREGQNDAPPFYKLRSFIWFGYPSAALSSEFNLENLLELDLSCSSNLERLWEDTEGAPKLKWLDLHDCPHLIEVPDLSKSRFLEKIDLHGCSHLTKIQNLSNLALLEAIDLNGCSSLTKIPDLSGSPSLKMIDLEHCRSLVDFPLLAPGVSCLRDLKLSGLESLWSFPSTIVLHYEHRESLDLSSYINLTTFPPTSGNIKSLDLSGTKIDEVPPSIKNLIKLDSLDLSECKRLKHISTQICKLKSLKELDLENCSQLESFPEILDKMEGLEFLYLSGTAIKELPHSVEHLTNLSKLFLSRCKNLEKLPSSISNLISLNCLDISDCPKLEILPDNLGNLKSLENLSMDRIAISQLPSTMMHLNKTVEISCCGCRYLRFTDLLGLPCSLTSLDFNDCNLEKIPEDIGSLSSLECLELSGNNFKSLPKSMKQLYKLTSLKVDNCNMLRSLTDLPSALKHLSASGCKQLRLIPDASEFANLVEADFIFTNCLELNETAVGNTLETLKKGYEEGDEIGKLAFFCPGSKVPEWIMHRTEGSSIVKCCELKFQMPWHDGSNGRPLLGFVVCAVIEFEKHCCIKGYLRHLCVYYECRCSDGDESSPNNITVASRNGGRYTSVGFRNETSMDSDHIAFRICKFSVPQKRTSDFSNCSFEFRLSDEKNPNCRIKSFGVCPIYAKHNISLPSFKKQKTRRII